MSSLRLSILDLAPITVGHSAADSFRNSLALAQRAEALGYTRYWVAEHHNIPGVASSATAVLIAHLAGGTKTMRVGSGGIMLPNHSPLVIAEQFGTLASLFGDRIDLGIGRAPGGDGRTARALRKTIGPESADSFPNDLRELQHYFEPIESFEPNVVHAVPGFCLNVPLYLLGSSDFSARLAAMLGLPFAFASHFAPDFLNVAIELYRTNFRPSKQLAEPYVMVGCNVVAAESDEEAARLFTTHQQAFLGIIRGARGLIPPPVDSMDGLWNPAEEEYVARMLRVSAVGSVATVTRQLQTIVDETEADELIATAPIYDQAARMRSIELAMEAAQRVERRSKSHASGLAI